MTKHYLLRLLLELQLLRGLRRDRDEAAARRKKNRDELPFKIVRMHGAKDEVIVRVENFLICKAAFEKALFV